jgi:endonuclease III
MEELVRLPGVGRKTANILLYNAYGIPGFGVDTHVVRVTNRLGLVGTEDPEKNRGGHLSALARKDLGPGDTPVDLSRPTDLPCQAAACVRCAVRALCRWPEKG